MLGQRNEPQSVAFALHSKRTFPSRGSNLTSTTEGIAQWLQDPESINCWPELSSCSAGLEDLDANLLVPELQCRTSMEQVFDRAAAMAEYGQ